MNGFSVNTSFLSKNNKQNIKRMKKYIVPATAVLGILAVVLCFLAIVPLKTVKELEICTATDTDSNKVVTYYNKDGKVNTEENYYMGEKNSTNKYYYDNDGNIEKVENYFFDQLSSITNYIYSDGLLIEKNITGTDNIVHSKTLYTYTDGLLKLSVDHDSDGNPINEVKYEKVV